MLRSSYVVYIVTKATLSLATVYLSASKKSTIGYKILCLPFEVISVKCNISAIRPWGLTVIQPQDQSQNTTVKQ